MISRCGFPAAVLALLLLAASGARSEPTGKAFLPQEVFAGRSQGRGSLQILLGKPRRFAVESIGTVQADGRLVLRQDVRFHGKPVQTRSWVMWQTQSGRYAATLTGAAGPAIGRTQGSRLTLRYPLSRWGLAMHQTLDLAADGRSIRNQGSIRLWGMPVGSLREVITLKVPADAMRDGTESTQSTLGGGDGVERPDVEDLPSG